MYQNYAPQTETSENGFDEYRGKFKFEIKTNI